MPESNIFSNYVKAGYPLLWVETFEEYRAMTSFFHEMAEAGKKARAAGKKHNPYSFFSWDKVDGITELTAPQGVLSQKKFKSDEPLTDPLIALDWAENPDRAADGMGENSILFLKDYHHYVGKEAKSSDIITRKIRNLIPMFKTIRKVLVIISPVIDIPTEIEKEIAVIHYDLPNMEELRIVLKSICPSQNIYPKDDELILSSALGMTSFEAENAFSVSLVEQGCFDPSVVQREKAAIVKKTGLLEVMESAYSLDDIGGLENLKGWMKERQGCFTDKARSFGVTPPKGLLLVGLPGTGKSLTAKAAGKILKRPILRLDVGRVFGSYVGESESNIRRCLAIAEACAPDILFIDEFEKFFGGADGPDAHETTKRVLAGFLTWMQDKTADVFIVATANNVDSIPPAMLRGGRFDCIFWCDLPDAKQREEILAIQLKKVGRDIKKFNAAKLTTASNGFSGAEIEVWIKEALVNSFSRGHKELKDEHMLKTASSVTPISRLMATEIQRSRDWGRDHGVKNASKSHGEPAKVVPISGKRRLSE